MQSEPFSIQQNNKLDKISSNGSTAQRIAEQTNADRSTIKRDEKFASAVDILAANTGIDVQELLAGNIGKITKKDITTIAIEKTSEQQKKIIEKLQETGNIKEAKKEIKKGRS